MGEMKEAGSLVDQRKADRYEDIDAACEEGV